MADPATSKGFATILGIKKATTTWASGAAAQCAAGDGVKFLDEGIKTENALIESEGIDGNAQQVGGVQGNETNSGSMSFPLYYQGLDVVLALALGTAGAPTQQSTTAAYLHTWKAADSHDGLYATFALGSGTYTTKEWPHVKIKGFELSWEKGQAGKLQIDTIADLLNLNADGGAGVNTKTTLASVTQPTPRDLILFSQMKCYINAQGGADFAASDEIYLSSFSAKYDSGMKGDDFTTRNGRRPDEPVEDGFATCTGSIKISRWNSNNHALITGGIAATAYKMKLLFTGPVCDSPYNYTFALWFPYVQFSGVPSVGGAKIVENNLDFKSWRATAVPTGFPTGATQNIVIQAVNKRTTDALA